MRILGVALVAAVLVLTGIQPAAAYATPGKVGLVSFVESSFSATADPATSASLTIDWPRVSHGDYYEIYMSRHSSMSSAVKYTSKSSSLRISHLRNGTDYFFQVRAVHAGNRGAKSTMVAHTTIRAKGSASGTPYRVMTYNLCSRVCDETHTTKYTWAERQPGALERVATYAPDVLAAQEANYLTTAPANYSLAIYWSGKRLLYKTSRFDLAAPDSPVAPVPPKDVNGCYPTSGNGATGYVLLGFHDHGCRYAVWAELVDKTNGKHVMFVDVHTVAGASKAAQREVEMNTLLSAMGAINTAKLPVVYAGDFNSHRNRAPDTVATVMHANGFYDSYDLATALKGQHINSYNGFDTTPRISYTWGDHFDHVWVVPGTSRVAKWRNGALIVDGRLPTPIPSDHSPVVVDLQLN